MSKKQGAKAPALCGIIFGIAAVVTCVAGPLMLGVLLSGRGRTLPNDMWVVLGTALLIVALGLGWERVTRFSKTSTAPSHIIPGVGERHIPENVRQAVLDRDDYICRYCGQRAQTMEVDHVIPVSQGGKSTLGNMVTACRECNRRKAGRTPQQIGMEVLPVRTQRK